MLRDLFESIVTGRLSQMQTSLPELLKLPALWESLREHVRHLLAAFATAHSVQRRLCAGRLAVWWHDSFAKVDDAWAVLT